MSYTYTLYHQLPPAFPYNNNNNDLSGPSAAKYNMTPARCLLLLACVMYKLKISRLISLILDSIIWRFEISACACHIHFERPTENTCKSIFVDLHAYLLLFMLFYSNGLIPNHFVCSYVYQLRVLHKRRCSCFVLFTAAMVARATIIFTPSYYG